MPGHMDYNQNVKKVHKSSSVLQNRNLSVFLFDLMEETGDHLCCFT